MKAVSVAKLRHAAALTLVGWCPMMPPLDPATRIYLTDAPLGKWDILESFDTAEKCETGKLAQPMIDEHNKERARNDLLLTCVANMELFVRNICVRLHPSSASCFTYREAGRSNRGPYLDHSQLLFTDDRLHYENAVTQEVSYAASNYLVDSAVRWRRWLLRVSELRTRGRDNPDSDRDLTCLPAVEGAA